jgi:hypothetical protein
MTITGIINEEWRAVSGYANYQVSNIGRVRNVKTERILKPNIRKDGYYIIGLYKDGSRTFVFIHRLVAQEFIENPDNKKCVDHINHDVSDNTILSLRWVSMSENGMNMMKRQNTSSKYKGVCFRTRANNWTSKIKINEKQLHLGCFDTEKEAGRKYNEFALEHFGEHAFVNEISSDEEDEEEEETDDATA